MISWLSCGMVENQMPAAQKGPEGLSFGSRPSSPPASLEPLASCICPQCLLLAFLSSSHALIILCQKVQTCSLLYWQVVRSLVPLSLAGCFPKFLCSLLLSEPANWSFKRAARIHAIFLALPVLFGCHSQSMMHVSLPIQAVHVRTL